ncbi:MAG: hypothetical protein AB1500_05770 [Bacillota bacterium]
MKKLNDFFAAGVIIGLIGNIWTTLIVLALILLGLNIRTPWNDLAALFFKEPEVFSFSAQYYGFLATFGVAITNGIIIGGLLKFTGRDFALSQKHGSMLRKRYVCFYDLIPFSWT